MAIRNPTPPPQVNRRTVLVGTAALAATALPQTASFAAGDDMLSGEQLIEGQAGPIRIRPINHATLVLEAGEKTIYVDPVPGPAAYQGIAPADVILITHEHRDHYKEDVVSALAGDGATIIANPAVHAMLPASLQSRAISMANGDRHQMGTLGIDAVPAYNNTAGRLNYHPQGRDNGYVLTVDGRRIYVAGDTEDIPEMRALSDIDLAFVPMVLPYTMDEEQAASGVLAFAPKVVYPYHYGASDTQLFKSLVDAGDKPIEVRLYDWYG